MDSAQAWWPTGYRERPAPAAVRDVAACVWAQVIPAGAGESVLVLPDGCTDLLWEPGRGALVAGPDTGPAPAQLTAGSLVLGLRFRPGAAGSLLGLPLSEVLDQRVDLADINPGLARRLRGTLSPSEAEAMLVRVVAELSASRGTDAAVLHGARLLGDPQTRTDDVASELGLSGRQLRRRWHAEVGYGPKTFQRVMRFRRFVSRLDAAAEPGALDLAAVAVETGYADQAHLTRECGRLAGVPPTALARTRLGPPS